MKTYTTIRAAREENRAVVTLCRPERRNALSLEMMRELIECFGEIRAAEEVRAVILAAEGRVFCSGHDLSEMTGRDLSAYREIFDTCSRLMETIHELPQPVIAEVQGLATAAGCQLAAACDLVVASENAVFATPGVKIGLFCTTPMVELVRSVGRKRALEMLLTGRLVPAREAAEWGLVNRVVAAAELNEAARELARQICGASPFTLSLGKQAFYSHIDLKMPEAYACAKEVMSKNALADDAQEGMAAFLEKRTPQWKGR